MRKYPEYKDSGVEWIGEIPKHWDSMKLKRLSPIGRGASPRPIDDPKYFDYEGEFSWVRISDVTSSDRYLTSTTQKLSELGSSLSVKLYPGDFFLSIAGSVGKPIITKIKCCIHDGFVWFPRLYINKEYLYYIFATGEPYKGLGKWGTQLNLNTETVGNIDIPVPPLDEINTVVLFLDKKTSQIDSLIEKKKRLIELLKEYRTAIIHHAVTKGLDPNVKMKDSGIEWIGEIPEHWEVKRLKFITQSISTGSTPPTSEPKYYREGALNWFSPSDFKENLLLETSKRKINGHSVDEKKVTLYDKNTVLLVGIGATLGKVGIINEPSTCNQQINAISFNIVFNPYFGLYYLHTIRDAIISFSNFSTLPILNQTQTKDIYITCPPRTEQDQIVQYIRKQYDKIEELISRTRFEIDYLNEYRTSLISDAVTGKIDVRDYAERVSESGVT